MSELEDAFPELREPAPLRVTRCFKCGEVAELVPGHNVGACCHALEGPCTRIVREDERGRILKGMHTCGYERPKVTPQR